MSRASRRLPISPPRSTGICVTCAPYRSRCPASTPCAPSRAERRHRREDRSCATGVPLPPELLGQLDALAAEVGVRRIARAALMICSARAAFDVAVTDLPRTLPRNPIAIGGSIPGNVASADATVNGTRGFEGSPRVHRQSCDGDHEPRGHLCARGQPLCQRRQAGLCGDFGHAQLDGRPENQGTARLEICSISRGAETVAGRRRPCKSEAGQWPA